MLCKFCPLCSLCENYNRILLDDSIASSAIALIQSTNLKENTVRGGCIRKGKSEKLEEIDQPRRRRSWFGEEGGGKGRGEGITIRELAGSRNRTEKIRQLAEGHKRKISSIDGEPHESAANINGERLARPPAQC